ncbi:TPA: hypothetical protein OUD11_004751 [Citrobacter werkmanii]|nr:hypothetical protein [Citrobacter werkmanii]
MKNTEWSKLRKHIHQQGGRSDGLYNAPKRSPLSDTPEIGETKLELLKAYIERYRRDNNDKIPTNTHLNNEFNMRATQAFYKRLSNE